MQPVNLNMIPLALVSPSGQIDLQSPALSILDRFVEGQITFITLQGFANKRYKSGQAFCHAKLSSQAHNNIIWMRPQPIFNARTRTNWFFLQTDVADESAKDSIHVFCSLISYLVMVALDQSDSLLFLSSIKRKVTDDASSIKYLDSRDKYKMAYLLCLTPLEPEKTDIHDMDDVTDLLLSRLASFGIENEVLSSYPEVRCLACEEQSLQYSSNSLQVYLQAETEDICLKRRSNTELMYGPIMADFMQIIAHSLKTRGKVNIEEAENQIEIDQAYEAFMLATKAYHESIKTGLQGVSEPDTEEIDYSLEQARKNAQEEYFKHGGATNMEYEKLLQDYIDKKQGEIRTDYINEHKRSNLEILEHESKAVLDQLNEIKGRKDPQKVKTLLEMLKINYESQAKGHQKYQLYTEYIKIFTPIAYEDVEADRQLAQNKRTNQKLAKQLQSKMSKSKGCCTGNQCSIF